MLDDGYDDDAVSINEDCCIIIWWWWPSSIEFDENCFVFVPFCDNSWSMVLPNAFNWLRISSNSLSVESPTTKNECK